MRVPYNSLASQQNKITLAPIYHPSSLWNWTRAAAQILPGDSFKKSGDGDWSLVISHSYCCPPGINLSHTFCTSVPWTASEYLEEKIRLPTL